MNPDIPKHVIKPMGAKQKKLLRWFRLTPDQVARAIQKSKAKQPGEEKDWLAITKQSLKEAADSILNKKHQTITGVKTKSMTKKALGNKAILQEMASIRENLAESTSNLHRQIQELESRLDVERRQRQCLWLMVLYCLESGQLNVPSNTDLLGWFLSRLEKESPEFEAMASRCSELMLYGVLGDFDEVALAADKYEKELMANGGQFAKFAPHLKEDLETPAP